jgi:2-hydroxymuconate-semialdehyde hydrolase
MPLFSRRGPLSPGEMFPAGEADYRVSRIRLRSGITVRVVETGDPAGDPVLLLSGWGSSVFLWRRNMPALAAAGFRAVAVDLKGSGLSDKPVGESEYTTAALVAHLGEILAAVALERPVIVGHSLGASIAFRFVRRHPGQVRALVLVSPVGHAGVRMLWLYKLLTPRFVRRFLPALDARRITRLALRRAYGKPRALTDAEVDEYYAPSQFPEFAIAQRDLLHGFEWNERVEGAIGLPVLLIHGSRDHLVRNAAIAAYRRAIPDIEVREIPEAGHVVPEEVSDDFNAALIGFLRRV